MLAAMVLSLSALGVTPAVAVYPDEVLQDTTQEKRARALSAQLRCLVCQNQSIDDSDAPLARDLRVLVRDRIKAGDDDGAVMSYIVARYGDFVLLKPPFKTETILLWLSPLLILAGGVWLARSVSRRSPVTVEPTSPLSDDERARVKKIVDDNA